MNSNQITVIVPVYNTENYLRKCVDSILGQRHREIQIILIDDGSTDQSGIICDEYAKIDDRIEVIHKSNGGSNSARMLGLDRALGEFIGFVDSDDYIDDNFYSDMLLEMKEYCVDFVHSAEIVERTSGDRLLDSYEPNIYIGDFERAEFIQQYILDSESGFCMSNGIVSKLFRAEFIKKIYKEIPMNQIVGEDMIGSCLSILNCTGFYLSKVQAYHYVQRSDSIMRQRDFDRLIDFCGLYSSLKDIFIQYKVDEILSESLQLHFQKIFLDIFVNLPRGRFIPVYSFRNTQQIMGKRVVLYGAGKVGQDYYAQLCKYKDIQIIEWVDQNHSSYQFEYRKVESVENLANLEFDYLIIAVAKRLIAEEIMSELISMGVCKQKILCEVLGVQI